MKRCKRVAMLLVLLFCCLLKLETAAANKQTIYNSPYVQFTADGKAWTTDKGACWYDEGTTVETGITSSLRELQTGEHYYEVKIQGEIPVGKWVVKHRPAKCVHNAYPEVENYHGIPYGKELCWSPYFSGWWAYCADCGEQITNMYVYMSKEAAESIDYLQISTELDYYYLCPTCNNLEQGAPMLNHSCKKISYNQYKVEYQANTGGAMYGGYMEDSIHMYHNATVYEGEELHPATHLTKNAYTRIGYEFTGWNTKADGTGDAYADGAEIYDLTDKDWNITGEHVILYAQWRVSQSSLQIDPAGGSYAGKTGITNITQEYGTVYHADASKIKPPAGFTFRFETNGGNAISPLVGTQSFREWMLVPEFKGSLKDNRYSFKLPKGTVDKLKALYQPNPITLPKPVRQGSSFGGWYADKELTQYVGSEDTQISPTQNMTLYALWVDLKLTAVNNLVVNGGKGAVDLSWSQSDNRNKVYLLYQQGENAKDWKQIHAENNNADSHKVTETFLYTGAKKSYVVPYTGLYRITANGAQGGNYGNYTGGAGGKVTADVWLTKGEELTYYVGGQNGTNCGGSGAAYGSNGGGRTSVYSDKQKTLVIAGGGGGAAINGNGGAGGSKASTGSAGEYGESGHAGGGGGYVGGKAGELMVHHHKEECYHYEDKEYTLLETVSQNGKIEANKYGTAYSMSAWLKAFEQKYATFASAAGGGYNTTLELNHLRTSTYDSGSRYLLLNYGRIWNPEATKEASGWYLSPDMTPEYTTKYIPTNGNTRVTIDVLLDGTHNNVQNIPNAGDAIDTLQSYLKVYDQDGKQLFSQNAADKSIPKTVTSDNVFLLDQEQTYALVRNDDYGILAVRFVETIDLPENTEGIYFTAQVAFADNCSGWLNVHVNKIAFTGGKTSSVICGYQDGQVLSSKPAYGGSNYVNLEAVQNYQEEMGVQEGNGMLSLQALQLDFVEGLSLKGVTAADTEAPEAISNQPKDISREVLEKDSLKITWKEPADNGTRYRHKAESYENGNGSLVGVSNITENVLVSGIAAYYYKIDDKQTTEITKQNGLRITKNTVTAVLTKQKQYLHVAAADVAGNLGKTTHILIGSLTSVSDEKIKEGTIHTRQLEIETGENVYYQAEENIYYVRSDGKTPFTLLYEAFVNPKATKQYQPNYMIFESAVKKKTSQNIFFVSSYEIQEKEQKIPNDSVEYYTKGSSLLEKYPFSEMKRTTNSSVLSAVQKFTLKQEADGEKITLYPRAAVEATTICYSEEDEDRQHGITLIGDKEGPVITGLEILEGREVINRKEGKVHLTVAAKDALSGVREFYITITNTDNTVEKKYKPEADGKIRIEITKEEPVFGGDFIVTAYAADNVGNESVQSAGTTEFSLEVAVKRILEPHEPVFKCGESGILTVTTYGYAERVEVEFPKEMTDLAPDLNQIYEYSSNPSYRQEETLQFMIPLQTPKRESYSIVVRAYKKDKQLEKYPTICTIEITEDILEELRTRLR